MTNKKDGVLYTGITNSIARRAYEHKNGLCEGFTKKYNLKILVYYEMFNDAEVAIKREKDLKGWSRNWKIKLIEKTNPQWIDLYDEALF
jgi:putative endonuclease